MDIINTLKDDYKRWEEKKLNNFVPQADNLMVEIINADSLKQSEKSKIKDLLTQHNLVFYQFKSIKKSTSDSVL